MRAACAVHPLVHSHQLAALDREIDVAGQAGGSESYRAGGGDLFEVTRAAWLDRAANHARVAVAVGDPWRAEAAAVEHSEGLAATGHEDWADRVAAGAARAAKLRMRSADASSAFTSLLLCLLGLHSAGSEIEQAGWRDQAAGAYRALREADPAFVWEDGPGEPRYSSRTPWTDSALGLVQAWIDDLGSADEAVPAEADDSLAAIQAGEERWRHELEDRATGGAEAHEPTLTGLVAVYRELAASLTGEDRASAATRAAAAALVAAGSAEQTGQDALARFVAEGLLVALAAAPLRTRAEEGLERQSLWPDPLVEHHWRTLLDRLDQARTQTEVELVSVHAEACFAVEADWNVVFLGSLLTPLRAACTYGWAGEEARAGLIRSAAVTHALLGHGPRRLLGVPRVADFVARILVPLAAVDSGPQGAFEGEAGFDLLGEARAWTVAVRDQGRAGPVDAAGMRDALLALFDRAEIPEPSPLARPLSLWGALFESEDLDRALARPRRPPVPGMQPVAGAG